MQREKRNEALLFTRVSVWDDKNVLELDRCWLHNPECSDSTTLHTRKLGLFCVSYISVELLLNTDEARAVKVALER